MSEEIEVCFAFSDTMPRWTEQHAARIFERSQKTEADFVESFTG